MFLENSPDQVNQFFGYLQSFGHCTKRIQIQTAIVRIRKEDRPPVFVELKKLRCNRTKYSKNMMEVLKYHMPYQG